MQLKTQNVDDENGFFSSARIHLFSTTTNEFDNLGNENIAIGETNDERVQEKMAGVLCFLFVHCLDRKAVFTVHVMAWNWITTLINCSIRYFYSKIQL